jgi:hypothetical protein
VSVESLFEFELARESKMKQMVRALLLLPADAV